ncbi:MAG: protein phosphatase 2C domain-containing protein [Planctomycetota bacterium]
MNALSSDEPFRAFGLTDVGQKRDNNQDQFLISELRASMHIHASSLPVHSSSTLFGSTRGQVLVVADGMGGHASGRRASRVALDDLVSQLLNRVHWFLRTDREAEDEFIESLQRVLRRTHARVLAEAASNANHRGMGTTLTMAHIVWPRMYVVHAGDSRCYLIRDQECRQLTTDHTLAHQMVQAGGLAPEDEAGSRWSNVLWNVLGGSGEQELIAEVHRVELRAGDTVLLCSDGLTRYINDDGIREVVTEGGQDVEAICHRLLGIANAAGGEDNITAVVFQHKGNDPETEPSTQQLELPLYLMMDQSTDESDLTNPNADGETLEADGDPLWSFSDEETLPEES